MTRTEWTINSPSDRSPSSRKTEVSGAYRNRRLRTGSKTGAGQVRTAQRPEREAEAAAVRRQFLEETKPT